MGLGQKAQPLPKQKGNIMFTEKGTLPIGVEFEGKIHKEFEIREGQVRDMCDVADDPEVMARAEKNDVFLGTALLARRIIKLGDIPADKITLDLVLNMDSEDYMEITNAEGRLAKKRSSFRKDS